MPALEISLPLPQLNDVLRETKAHWSHYATEKKRHTSRVAWLARAHRCPRVERPVRFLFSWVTADFRIDPDNLVHGQKYVLDGLVTAGVLPQDSRRWIRGLAHDFPPVADPVHPRVTVSWEEVEG